MTSAQHPSQSPQRAVRSPPRRVILASVILPQSIPSFLRRNTKAEMISSAIFWTSPRRAALAALAVLMALAAMSLLPAAAAAQEPAREEVRHIGSHDIRVVPVNYNLAAGYAQLSVFVTHPETGAPVPDARVVLLATNDKENHQGWAEALNSPAIPERYDVRLNLEYTGKWDIGVDVSSSLGADLADVTTLEVPALQRYTDGSLVFFGMFGVIILGIAYVWWSARRNYRRRRSAQS